MNERPLELQHSIVQRVGWSFVCLFLAGCLSSLGQNLNNQAMMPSPTIAIFFLRQEPVKVDRAGILSQALVPLLENELPQIGLYNPLAEFEAHSVASTAPLTTSVDAPSTPLNRPEVTSMLLLPTLAVGASSDVIQGNVQGPGAEESRIGQSGTSINTHSNQVNSTVPFTVPFVVEGSGMIAGGLVGLHNNLAGAETRDKSVGPVSGMPTAVSLSNSGVAGLDYTSSGNINSETMVESASNVGLLRTPVVELFAPEIENETEHYQNQPQNITGLSQYNSVEQDVQQNNLQVIARYAPTPSSAFALKKGGAAMYYNSTTGNSHDHTNTACFGVILLLSVLYGWFVMIRKKRSNNFHADALS